MKSDQAEQTAERDELWESLRGLLPEIRRIAQQEFTGTERELMLVTLLARIVCAELDFRGAPSPNPEDQEVSSSVPPTPSSNGKVTPPNGSQDH